MRTLFWKLFGAFWLTTIVILTAAVFLSFRLADTSGADFDIWSEANLQDILRISGVDGLRRHVTNPANFPPGRTVYVVDRAGRDIARRELPPQVERRLQRAWPALETGTRERSRRPPRLRLPVLQTDDGETLLAMPGPVRPPLFGVLSIAHVRWVVLGVAALISLLVFWWLSRSLTRPVTRISATARQLARGDMTARAGVAGNDEIGQLAAQFDAMASELEAQSKNRRELFRNIAHELRAPLTRMQIATDLLERKPQDSAAHIDRIRYEIGRVENLTRQVVSLARAEQLVNASQVSDLNAVMTRIIRDAGFEAASRQVEVRYEAPDRALPIRGDADIVASAIENVVRNAVQMSPVGGEVTVTVEAGDFCAVTVADTGPGVEPAALEKIFEPFFRVDTNRPGAGIGLAITQRVLRQVGGTIEAANRPGGGLEVKMRWPAIGQADSP